MSVKTSQTTHTVRTQNDLSLRQPVMWSVHPRHLKYCLINRFSAQDYLMCSTLVCSLSSSSTLSELICWQQHLGGQWLICPNANSSGWPISELWLSRTSVNELNVGMRWFLRKQLLHRLVLTLCEDCISSLRSFQEHFYGMLLELFFLNCKGAKYRGLQNWTMYH